MALTHSLRVAQKRRNSLDAKERKAVLAICRDIHLAQKSLTEKAAPILSACMVKCRGLCCKNIHPADIITEWDLFYAILLAPQIEPELIDCLAGESFFSTDCIFLKNGSGPCIFPENIRPERCIISFCKVEPLVEKEIGRVMGGFSQLIHFIQWLPLRRVARRLTSLILARRSTDG